MAANDLVFTLPDSIVTSVELNRLARESEAVDEILKQASLRNGGEAVSLPKVSRLLNEMLDSNQLNILHEKDRRQLKVIMEHLQKTAPTVHISFSTDPAPDFTKKLVTWMRQELHPYLLLRIGLQPSIGAGCILRTSSKYFDFSLREHFVQQKHVLIEKIRSPENAGEPDG